MFLREVYLLECSATAFDDVVAHCSLAIVKELMTQSRSEGCSTDTITRALKSGRNNVAHFLCGFPIRDDLVALLTCAASHGTVRIVKQLHSRLQEGESAYKAMKAAASRKCHLQFDVVQFLCSSKEREAVSFLKQAVAKSDLVVVKNVLYYFSVEELIDAEKRAVEHGEQEIAERLAREIRMRPTI